MKPLTLVALALLGAGAWIGTVVASRSPQQQHDYDPPTGLPRGGVEILEARPFVLDRPFVHEWRAEQPSFSAGYVLVLNVDEELARPRETYEPVLYVGDQTAERVNRPENGGHMVVVVPAPVDARGRVALDLDSAPIWFGTGELPERVDAARITIEHDLALRRGIGPATKTARAKLSSARDETIYGRTREELNPYLADLIEQYSPEETDLVAMLRR